MGILKEYLKESVVQIALIAVAVKILLVMLSSPTLSVNLEQVLTFGLFAFVVIFVAHFIGRKKLSLFNLFLTGFFSILIYNQGIAIFQLIGAVPIMIDIFVGIEMGLIVMLVGYLKGVKQ